MNPESLEYGGAAWSLLETVTEDGYSSIEYISGGRTFPVAFVMDSQTEAQELMYNWLVEQGLV